MRIRLITTGAAFGAIYFLCGATFWRSRSGYEPFTNFFSWPCVAYTLSMKGGITKHGKNERLPRHRHRAGYAALVLAGGYVEAGDNGRFRVQAGHVVVHSAFEAHVDEFCMGGAVALNLPLVFGLMAGQRSLDDIDLVARLAESDLQSAAEALCELSRPTSEGLADWPDLLAHALVTEPQIAVAEWARRMGIAPQSVSRGFRRVYGVSPKRYRVEHRALRAVSVLQQSSLSLADTAAELGFADQAHLGREVSRITGATPRQLRVQSVQETGLTMTLGSAACNGEISSQPRLPLSSPHF